MNELFGNLIGLKPSDTKSLQNIYRRKIPFDSFITPEVAKSISEISKELNRQIGLLIDRQGVITHVIIGTSSQIFLPDFGRIRAGKTRFRGLRLILTHLKGEPLSQDNITDLVLLRLDTCFVIQVLDNTLPGPIEYAYLIPPNEENEVIKKEYARSVYDITSDYQSFIKSLEFEFTRTIDKFESTDKREKAILIGVSTSKDRNLIDTSISELEQLSDTAGLKVLDRIIQFRPHIDPKYVLGKGKLEEIVIRSMQIGADVLIFDQDLKPSQLRNISDKTDLKVLDRTQLILDIFAQHAESKAGKLQVELAQMRYLLPRLSVMNTAMSRLTGGIGGRGPGETKLEINKRRANERLTRLKKELQTVSLQREERRKARKRNDIPVVAIVGYTNAGKSTLLNRMTQSVVRAENRLFATLDPASRRMRFPKNREIILIDTVGFIQNLPEDLMDAFKSTLEEISTASLIIHLVDITSPNIDLHIETVQKILEELKVIDIKQLLVFNKSEQISSEELHSLEKRYSALSISALTGDNLNILLESIESMVLNPIRTTDMISDSNLEEDNLSDVSDNGIDDSYYDEPVDQFEEDSSYE